MTNSHQTKELIPPAIQSFFNKTGPWFYSFFFQLAGYRSSLKYFVRRHQHRLALVKGMRILDAGIGTGFLTINLLTEAPVSLTVTGLDFSDGMVSALRNRLRRLGLEDKVTLQMGDMRGMPFSDGEFDLVMTSAAIEYLPRVEDGFKEFSRVLRPGGKLLAITTRDSLMGRFIGATWQNTVYQPEYIKACMADVGIHNIQRLYFPWWFAHVNWWGVAFLGEKQ
ncbi:MAG: class I SAM-dependent methyltransferase [Thermodesulfobacteriota bacterium]